MDQESKKEIEEIIGLFECPRDFRCYKSGLEVLCKARSVADGSMLICFEEHPHECKFLALERGYICECPLRIYIAKKLKK